MLTATLYAQFYYVLLIVLNNQFFFLSYVEKNKTFLKPSESYQIIIPSEHKIKDLSYPDKWITL